MDRGIRAEWYDMPEGGRSEYLSWLHEVHLPQMLARPGYLWAAHVECVRDEAREKRLRENLTHTNDPAVPAGNDYLILYGAETPHTFFDPSPSELAEDWPPDAKEMLGRRSGVRTCIFIEQARGNGPEVASRAPGLTPGPAIQFGSFNITSLENEEALSRWFARHRFPDLESMEGCVGIRKLVSCYGWAKHAILYEFVSMAAHKKNFGAILEKYPEKKALMGAVTANVIHSPFSPTLGNRIWPPAGG